MNTHPSDSKEEILVQLRGEVKAAMSRWVQAGKSLNCWREPLVAVASARDPLFEELKRVVDPGHAMPNDLLSGARSVVVFFLPFHRGIGEENSRSKGFSSRSWAESYVVTNSLIQAVGESLQTDIARHGYETVVPPPTHNFDEEKLVSAWSHKHIAYIAGLGTFGHHHMLITTAGCCGRLGSLVTTMPIPGTPRPDKEYCLVKSGKECYGCVSKCRYGALFKSHFDRHACYRQCLVNDSHFGDLPLTDVCGKCACDVACSYEIPTC